MKSKHYITILLVTGIFLGVFSSAVPFGSTEAENVDVIVGFAGIPDLGLLRQNGGEVYHVYSIIPAVYVSLPQVAIESLRGNSKITYIHENGVIKESGYTVRWGVERVNAPQAWGQSTGDGVKVAVLDTGVGPHKDLTIYDGYDFVNNDANASDDEGHGTMVAGIIAASANSSIGVAGVAPNAHIYAVKILDSNGIGTVARAIQGIEWAISHNMQIISMSWTLNDENYALRNALQAAYSRGILLVAAAGNSGNIQSGVGYPACYDTVIAVSATKHDNTRVTESCFGSEIELAAPGELIYSTYYLNNGLGVGNGTSMAAAFVSGAAALVWAKNPALTNVEVRDILDKTAFDLGSDMDIYYGYGLVNASAAVSATPSTFKVDFSWSPSTIYADGTVTFDASASFGHVSGFTEYTWDFGDGTNATFDAPVATHTFAVNGSYDVNLTVSDVFGFKNSTVSSVMVLQDSVPPVTDSVPPVTVDNYDGLLHTSAFTIALDASDAESGVAETYYRINDGSTKTISANGQPIINVDGLNNKLEYWSVDFAGNEESPHKVLANIKLDTTPASTPSPSVKPTPSPTPTSQPTTEPTLTPTGTPTGSTEETAPPEDGQFPVLLVVGVVSVTLIAVAVAVVVWFKRK
ncbi:S8 family serine peptidase [Candidatus Bathyarchaeota archaeon]|nr:S8 family serine peptidase [Candidatus Bathyarchaeota archaeon]